MTAMTSGYPIGLEVAPAAPQSRLTIFFRPILAIPAAIVGNLIREAGQVVALIAWFVILFTGRLPVGLANFMAGSLRWETRVYAYVLLLTGSYPPFSLEDVPDYPAHVPVAAQLEGRNRLTVFFRLLLVIPHIVVICLLLIAATVVLFIACVAALFTGSVPVGMHNFIAGVLRWTVRVSGYTYFLTDEYPPFSMN